MHIHTLPQAKEREKVEEKLGKWSVNLLNSALDVFELPRGQGDEGKKVCVHACVAVCACVCVCTRCGWGDKGKIMCGCVCMHACNHVCMSVCA